MRETERLNRIVAEPNSLEWVQFNAAPPSIFKGCCIQRNPLSNLASLDWVFRWGHHIALAVQNGKSLLLSQFILILISSSNCASLLDYLP